MYTFLAYDNGESLGESSWFASLALFWEYNDLQVYGRMKALFGKSGREYKTDKSYMKK